MHPFAVSSTVCRIVRSGRVWLCDDDLGMSRVPSYALAQDARGYLWSGSEDGPLCFDGLVWAAPAGLAALGGCVVSTIAATADATLWLGTRGAGLVCVDLDATPYRVRMRLTQGDGLPSTAIRAVCADAQGQLWAATDAGLVVLADNSVKGALTTADGLPSNDVWTLCCDQQGQLWAGTAEGLALVADGTVTTCLSTAHEIPPGGVHHLCCDARGQIWVGMLGGAVLRADVRRAGRPVLAPVHDSQVRVRVLCPDQQGRLWVGTSAGVLVLEQGTLRDAFGMDDGLPTMGVWALCCDRDGRIWAGTSTGLALLENTASPVCMLPSKGARPTVPAFALAPDHGGRLWVGTEAGVTALDSVTGSPLPVPELPVTVAQEMVWALQLDQQQQLWVGTHRDGLVCLDPDSGAVHAHIRLANDVPALCLVGERQLWAGLSGQGLICVDSQTRALVHQIGTPDGLPQARVLALQPDRQGRLWAGTWSGWLAGLDPASGVVLCTLCLHGDRADHPITDLALDGDGLLWASTYGGGLVCMDPERGAIVRVVTTAEGLPSDLLYSCQVDAQGHLWLGTRRGVARYTPAANRCVTIGRSLGLPHDECNARARYLDAQGQLWIGTVQGVGRIDTTRIPAAVPPCSVHLTALRVMGHDRVVSRALEIEDSDYDLVFEYGAVTFTAAPQVTYRVQLVGLDADWSAPTAQRSARYTTLRPGAYTFRVAARNWGGQWSEPLEVPFRVIRNRQAQERDDALERERIEKEVLRATAVRLGELNRQLEETDRLKTELIARIQEQAALFERLSRQDGLTGLLNRRALDARLAEDFGRAQREGRPLTVVLADIDHFKRINDTFSHHVGDRVLQVVAELCRAHVRAGASIGRYGGEELGLILPETSIHEGVAVCERLRCAIDRYAWHTIAAGLRVTISLGASAWTAAPHHEKMLADADTYLYAAKSAGRNCTRSAIDAVTPDGRAPQSLAS